MKKNIRFLVTERCNYSCYFCGNKEGESNSNREVLKVSNYLDLYSIHKEITGHKGVTIAGGEPLIYGNINELVMNLHNKEAEITLVTNGVYIEDHLGLFQYLKRVYINIHTLNESSYEKIVGVTNSMFKQIKKNIETLRSLYGDLEIVLNIVNSPENNLNILELRELFEFSRQVKADVNFTGVESTKNWSCISFDELYSNLIELGYMPINISGKLKKFSNGPNYIYFNQCIFPINNLNVAAIKYCDEEEKIFVHDDGRISIGNFKKSFIDFYQEIKDNDYEKITSKMKNILEDNLKDSCVYCLKQCTKN